MMIIIIETNKLRLAAYHPTEARTRWILANFKLKFRIWFSKQIIDTMNGVDVIRDL